VIGSLSKEDGRKSNLSHKALKLAVGIIFVLWASEKLYFKFFVLTRVVIFN